MENRELVRLAEWIAQSDNIVFFAAPTESITPNGYMAAPPRSC